MQKTIRKDVPRTDRQTDYYKGDDNEHLQWLHDILVTFAVFEQDVGYAQGMNDVLSMILFVMDNEVRARLRLRQQCCEAKSVVTRLRLRLRQQWCEESKAKRRARLRRRLPATML